MTHAHDPHVTPTHRPPAIPPPSRRSADQLEIVRRVPLPGYDLTLLLTHRHLERYSREGLLDFICQVGVQAAAWVVMLGHQPLHVYVEHAIMNMCAMPARVRKPCVCPRPPQFVEDVHSEVSAMKLGLRSRARAVVQRYWQELDAVGPAAAGAAAPGGAG